jgi:hypothetical protein
MPEQYDPRKLPVAVDTPVEPEFVELPQPTSGTQYWRPILIACILGVAVYVMYFRPSTNAVKSTQLLKNPGWDYLSACSDATSLDGRKALGLLSDGRATVYENTPIKGGETIEDHTTHGTWRFDEASKRYSITFKGESADYLVVSSEGTRICMLIKGEISAADLSRSWFAFPIDGDTGDDRERDTPGL